MNKITYALALGAGLVLSLAGPSVHAAPIVQQLSTPDDVGGAVQQPVPADRRRGADHSRPTSS